MTAPPAPFIVGVERSGTTLLRMMLDSHRELTIPFETHFLHKLLMLSQEDVSKDKFFNIVTQSASWRNMALDASVLSAALDGIDNFSIPEGIRIFYSLCAARFAKQRWGDKTPTYLNWMVGIQLLLPEAHFIHIIRDGRDVACSFRGLWFGPGDDVEAAARHWVSQVNHAKNQSEYLVHYMEIRYEDLVLDPQKTLTKITDFLQLNFDPEMLNYHKYATGRLAEIVQPFGPNCGNSLDIESFTSIYSNTKKPPDPSRIGRWREEMRDVDQRRFEAIAGSLLAALGYETRFPFQAGEPAPERSAES
jgi:hypothetical protein